MTAPRAFAALAVLGLTLVAQPARAEGEDRPCYRGIELNDDNADLAERAAFFRPYCRSPVSGLFFARLFGQGAGPVVAARTRPVPGRRSR